MLVQLDGPQQESAIQVDADVDRVRGKKRTKKHKAKEEAKQVCASTLMTMDIKNSMFLVGDVFMRKFYTIFDRDNDRVGLATAVNGASGDVEALKKHQEKQAEDSSALAQKKK
jgi:hypothetical protein